MQIRSLLVAFIVLCALGRIYADEPEKLNEGIIGLQSPLLKPIPVPIFMFGYGRYVPLGFLPAIQPGVKLGGSTGNMLFMQTLTYSYSYYFIAAPFLNLFVYKRLLYLGGAADFEYFRIYREQGQLLEECYCDLRTQVYRTKYTTYIGVNLIDLVPASLKYFTAFRLEIGYQFFQRSEFFHSEKYYKSVQGTPIETSSKTAIENYRKEMVDYLKFPNVYVGLFVGIGF